MLKLIGFYDYTMVLTYLNLLFAIFGMSQSMNGHYTAAVVCLLISGLCDAFDGAVARTKKDRTADEKEYGIQLDSLCDAVSFGVAPAFLCYYLGVRGIFGVMILAAFCLNGVIRLAFFNMLETKRQKTESGCTKFYRGLPITSTSIILPITYCLRWILPESFFGVLLHIVVCVTAFLFVLDFQIPKFDFGKILIKLNIVKE